MLDTNRTQLRRQAQLNILESGQNIVIGNGSDLPIKLSELCVIDKNSSYVKEVFDKGLSAIVYKLKIAGKAYTLKKKRKKILVDNIDGQTSFLNEIQRRKELWDAKKEHPEMYDGIVDTIYANLECGVILSDWIEGNEAVVYNSSILKHLFNTLLNMEKIGIFENDLSAPNIIVKDDKITLFDFGYAYRFNPLTDINMEGMEMPVMNMAERFEARSFMMHLLDVETLISLDIALSIYRIEKQVLIDCFESKVSWLKENNASHKIISYHEDYICKWQNALKTKDSLYEQYKLDGYRSFLIDVIDDISGKSCTPDTIAKVGFVINLASKDYDFLKKNNAFIWEDEDKLTKEDLIFKYKTLKEECMRYQLKNINEFYETKRKIERAIRLYIDN